MKKSVKVPFIPGLDKMSMDELLSVMEQHAARDYIASVNWPEQFAYQPVAVFDAARSEKHLFISYFVRSLDLKAEFGQSNDPVWQDSCVEFFVRSTDSQSYHNFEFNCIGTCLASRKDTPEERVFLTPDEIAKIIRHTSVKGPAFPEKQGIFSWNLIVGIPFTLFGADPENLPKILRVNFFKCGDTTSHPHYLSWSPISWPKPNFHLPEFFGELILK